MNKNELILKLSELTSKWEKKATDARAISEKREKSRDEIAALAHHRKMQAYQDCIHDLNKIISDLKNG